MNNPFDYIPHSEIIKESKLLRAYIDSLEKSDLPSDRDFFQYMREGKMLGILIAVDDRGVRHVLRAFSGQIGNKGFHFGDFVEPVFDYLSPTGYFKTGERAISKMNDDILVIEKNSLLPALDALRLKENQLNKSLFELKERYKLSKVERSKKRKSGNMSEEEQSKLISESQFEKAEISRAKKRMAEQLQPLEEKVASIRDEISRLKTHRKKDSEALQDWLFTNFELVNAKGQKRNLKEIFRSSPLGIPPSGAGECCAPKLLNKAFQNGWTPLLIGEFWYGESKKGEVRHDGDFYPACRGKCLPILTWMLDGLNIEPPLNAEESSLSNSKPEIIYKSERFCIVEKPSGMLTVPGKGRQTSLQDWLKEQLPEYPSLKVAHRLDQDTSGLVLVALDDEAFSAFQRLFATRQIKKRYVADLEGDYREKNLPQSGEISLPLAPDILDRPRQKVDFTEGKESVTNYEFAEVKNNRSRIIFTPLTGRTHQLRVHASSSLGLSLPIVGDRLYGKRAPHDRLHLHAAELSFTSPFDRKHHHFKSTLPF